MDKKCIKCNGKITKTSTRCIVCSNKYRRGEKRSEEWKKKMSEMKKGENNPNWKGDKVGYNAIHSWVKCKKPRPQFCEECKIGFPIDLANISQKYSRDLSDWEYLCRRCHMIKDGRMKNIKKERIHPIKYCEICNKKLRFYLNKRCLKHVVRNGMKNPNYKHGKFIKKL